MITIKHIGWPWQDMKQFEELKGLRNTSDKKC